jgi:hypothetical protein
MDYDTIKKTGGLLIIIGLRNSFKIKKIVKHHHESQKGSNYNDTSARIFNTLL